jgi:hypothetical protein
MTDATTIYRALLVDAKTEASWDEYIRAQSRADDGRDPAATGPQSVEEFDEHIDRGRGVATDGGEGAIDAGFEDAERSYEEQLADALEGINTEPMAGGIVIDLVTRQPMFVREKVADDLAEYYDEEDFDLATYKGHPYLPVRPDDAVYDCVFISRSVEDAHNAGKTYAYPRGRLMVVPVDEAWRDVEVGDL